jgi:signal transduction histidine kinase
MGNASKFTFKGGISLKIEFQHNNLISSVKDTGIGIKKEDLNKLFRFFGCIAKSKNINRGGMGLGLTISKMIIQQLDGTINVESLPNQGSNFTFKIPITEYFYEAEGASPNVSQLLI